MLREEKDIAVIAMGYRVNEALKVAEALNIDGTPCA